MKRRLGLLLLSAVLGGCAQVGTQSALIRETPVIEPVTAQTQNSYTTGNLALRRGDLQTAVTSYRQALEDNPSLYEARYNLGITLLKQAREELFLYAGLAPDTESLTPIAPMLQCLETYVGEGTDALCRAP